MNKALKDYLDRKMSGSNSRRDGNQSWLLKKMESRNSDYEDSRDYARSGDRRRDMEDMRDNRSDYEDYRMDSRDYNDDYADYHRSKPIKLSKSDIHRWNKMFENFDGTRGAHYDMQQVIHAADKIGVKFDDFSEKEFCVAVNMMYADYGHVIKEMVPDKELICCAKLAKAFLEDPDAPEASEKLALYFHCIVDCE